MGLRGVDHGDVGLFEVERGRRSGKQVGCGGMA
jgi:hypothetical protein